jgi:hypothetical protein
MHFDGRWNVAATLKTLAATVTVAASLGDVGCAGGTDAPSDGGSSAASTASDSAPGAQDSGAVEMTAGDASATAESGVQPNDAANAGMPDAQSDAASPDATPNPESGTLEGGPYLSIPLTGCPLDYYYVPVSVDGQAFTMVLDTGSTDTAVATSSCSDCGVSPEYAPAAGSCSGSTSSSFGTGSESWSAQVCSTTVSAGGEMPAVTMNVGGITSQMGQFFNHYDCAENALPGPSQFQGIFGLGPLDLDTIGSSSQDAYFSALVQQGVADKFAVLLCSTGGVLWFGGYDPQYASGAPQFTPMSMSQYWAVGLSGVGLGTQQVGGADPQSIVDTGTQGLYLASAAYSTLMAVTSSGFTSVFGASTLNAIFSQNNCAAPSSGQTQAQIDAALPPLTMTFPAVSGGAFTLSLAATASYLVPVTQGTAVQYCLAVGDYAATGQTTIIGGNILRANITVFDEGNQQIGFAPQSFCQ